jgi:hypothetical protein
MHIISTVMRKNEEAGWPSRVISHYLNGWYSVLCSSTDVPVSHCTLTAPGTHSALYSESTDDLMDRA